MLSSLSGYAQEITDTTVVNVAYGVQSSKTQSAAISTVKGERSWRLHHQRWVTR